LSEPPFLGKGRVAIDGQWMDASSDTRLGNNAKLFHERLVRIGEIIRIGEIKTALTQLNPMTAQLNPMTAQRFSITAQRVPMTVRLDA
jgi:hypothetical protein